MRTLQIVLIVLFFAACRSSLTRGPLIEISKQEHERGKTLVAESDCLTCHQLSEKTTGPGYVQIAKRYPATNAVIEQLASKIITGGSGKWGEVPMTPHFDMRKDEAVSIVKYVLTVNKFE